MGVIGYRTVVYMKGPGRGMGINGAAVHLSPRKSFRLVLNCSSLYPLPPLD